METKIKNPNITVSFIEYAKQAPEVHHWMYCEGCGEETDHDLHCSGNWEYYTCPCGYQIQQKVR